MVLGIAAVLGIVSTLLPLMTISVSIGGGGKSLIPGLPGGVPGGASESVMVLRDWRGIICLLGYLAALAVPVLCLVSPPNAPLQKPLAWAALGVGGLVTLLALWLLILAFTHSSSANVPGLMTASASAGIGAYLNILTALAVAAGGFLKVREEKLI
jgi:hypothetical protein